MDQFIKDIEKNHKVVIDNKYKRLLIDDMPFAVRQNVLDLLRKNGKYENYLEEIDKLIIEDDDFPWD